MKQPAPKVESFTDKYVHGNTCVHKVGSLPTDLCNAPVVKGQNGWLCEQHEQKVLGKKR